MTKLQRRMTLFAALIALALTPAILEAQNILFPGRQNTSNSAEAKRLIDVLGSDADTHQKATACQQLAILGDKEAIPALAALLGDEKLAAYARCGLESIADPAAGEALRDALGKIKGKLLIGVVNSIGVRRDAKAVAALGELAAKGDNNLACAALMALGRIATPEAVEILLRSLKAENASIRTAAADASMTCAERLTAEANRDAALTLYDAVRQADVPQRFRVAATYQAIINGGPDGLKLMVEQLKAADDKMFAAAVNASRRIPLMSEGRKTKVASALLEALKADPAPARKVLLINALGARGHEAIMAVQPALDRATFSGPVEVRLAAIRVLGERGSSYSKPLLLKMLVAAEPSLAQAAEASLMKLHGEGVDDAIAAELAKGNLKMRVALLRIVAQRRIAAALPDVLKAADDQQAEVRHAAIHALGRIIPPADLSPLTTRLLAAKDPEEIKTIEEALDVACLRVVDRDACAEKLVAAMPQATPAGQRLLLDVIRRVGGAGALKFVAAQATSDDEKIQDAATRALGNWMSADAAPVLLDLAKTLKAEKLRTRALHGYIRLAMQMDMTPAERLAMGEEAFRMARREEERKLALQVLEKTSFKPKSLFDGRTFQGWEGDTKNYFHIEQGAVVGGSLKHKVPHNAFLCTTKSYANFVLRLECKLRGPANGGVQIRSQRVPNHFEVSGYQADMDAGPNGGFWGTLYDESRRNRPLAKPDSSLIGPIVKAEDWNQYEIRCEGLRIRLYINGVQTVDYTEKDLRLQQNGIIGLQIHGGQPSEAWYRNIVIQELP